MLEVRARQPGGYQWSAPLEFQLEIFKPWYFKSWFLYPVIVFILFLLGYFFRFSMQRRINKIQEILNFAQQKLAERESELNQKIIEFDVQQEELANANSNIHTLELFVKLIELKSYEHKLYNFMKIICAF